MEKRNKEKKGINIAQLIRIMPPQWRRVVTLVLIALGGLSGLEALTGVDISPPYQSIRIQKRYAHPEGGWIGMKSAEEKSGYSRASLYQMARSGRIKAAKDSRGRWKFDPSNLPSKKK